MSDVWNRRIVFATTIALGLGLVVVSVAPASLAATQIQVLDREGPYEKDLDLGKPGFSAGDVVLESHPLIDAGDGTTVAGRDFERVTVLRVRSGGQDFEFIFDATLRFDEGDIVLYGEGLFSAIFEDGVTFPVTGGTGAYEGARGVATFTATATEGESLITIDLITT